MSLKAVSLSEQIAQHLAEQIRIASGGDAEHADRSVAGLKAAGLL